MHKIHKNIIAISGSLRAQSFNGSLLKAVKTLAPESLNIEIVDISNIPLYNQDLEKDFPANFPKAVQDLKDKIMASDGVIFATPEYNRSVPGVLKNVIDWASRPYGKNAFAGKPVLVLGVTVGQIGTAVAQYHLKQILLCLDMHVIGQPEFYLGGATSKFDAEGNLTDQSTKNHIVEALEVLERHTSH